MITYIDGRPATHAGQVLSLELNVYRGFEWYDDFAHVWNAEARKVERVHLGSGHQGGMECPIAHATVDATPEVLAAVAEWKVEVARAAAREAAAREAATVRVGKRVKVAGGKYRGFVGVVFWIGRSAYSRDLRAGITTTTGKVFTTLRDLAVI